MESSGAIATGQLIANPLVELLHELAQAQLSGAVRLGNERVKAVVYLEQGEVIFAVSNIRPHRLSECALEWKFATASLLAGVPKRATEVEYGYALVESGVLTVIRLQELFVRLTEEVLRYVLHWIEGEWTYDARIRLAQSVQAKVSTHSFLVETARQFPPEFASSRITNLKRQIAQGPTPPNALPLSRMESFVLSRVENGMQLAQLREATGLPEADVLRSVYALTLGGFVQGSLWPAALTQSQLHQAELLTAKRKRATAQDPVEPTRPFAEATLAKGSATAGTGAGNTNQRSNQPAPVESDPAEDRRSAEAYLSRVEAAQNHYDVLVIDRAADNGEIKRAYYEIARRFHPDRFHQEQGTTLHAGLQSAFARVSQAYDNLRDPKLRAAHDKKLDGNAPGVAKDGGYDPLTADPNAGTPRQQAETRFQQGLAAMQKGNVAGALILCAQAAKLAPKEARYRAGYGQTLAQVPEKRHEAEAEFREAIRLEPKNATFLVVLAEFYSAQGYNLRAIAELERALQIDPANVAARRRLTDLQM